MTVPFYTSTREYESRKQEFDEALQRVIARGDFILGTEVAEFEKEAAGYLGVPYAVGVASGSDALVIGSDLLGFKDGAEVLTPTFTFFSSTSCVTRLGGKPVLVDQDPETLNMSLEDAASKVSPKTTGIIPVHLFLQPTPMQKVMDFARANKLTVLEDAAEAWGMESYVDGAWKRRELSAILASIRFSPPRPWVPGETRGSW